MSVRSRCAVVGVLLIAAVVGVAASAQVPDGVSPGAADHIAAIEGRCPSFSWGVVPGAEYYQLIGYRLPEGLEPIEADLGRAELVLSTEVPGAAASWTPNLSQCLAPEGSYVWFVRAVFREEQGEVVEASEWSYGRFFEISTTPSASEVDEALDALRRYTGRSDGTVIDTENRGSEVTGTERLAASELPGVPPQNQKSVSSAKTAIRGSLSDTTGETYGVVGVSSSVEGAGMGAVGAAGGPDLVLDGSADSLPDTELSQSGIDRPSGAPQTFDIENSGGGGMTLQVDGVEVITTASAIDAETLDGFDSADFATDVELALHAASADHDGRYFTEDELSTSGGGGAVHWDNLTGVPADLADGDDDTLPILPGASWGLHTVTIIDGGGGDDVCGFTSVTVGADGLPITSYYDHANGDLKVAHCLDLACTSATTNVVDSAGVVGQSTSITVGADGLPVISYYDDTNDDLKVAHCSDVTCTSATTNIVDSGGLVGRYSSITAGADGLPIISYYYVSSGDLKVAHCSDLECTAATLTTIDTGGEVGLGTSATVGADGLPVISYYDITNGDLKVAHCSVVTCTSATTNVVDSGGHVGGYPSITVGADGLPVISYYDTTNGDLKVAHCSDLECSSATKTTVDSAYVVGLSTSITVGTDGLPVISYHDAYYGLKAAHCSDLECSSAALTVVDGGEDFGAYMSITVGADGLPVISYCDWSNLDLKVAHCGNVFCIPYARR